MVTDAPDPETRASLLLRIRDFHDHASWELFVRTYGPAVYQFCARRGVHDSHAVDLVQDVLTQVAVSIRSFEYDPSRGRFRDWLGAVVRSKLARHWRANVHNVSRADLDHIASTRLQAEWADECDAHLLRVAMAAIRESFTPLNWKSFELTWVDGRSAKEVAAALAIPVAQVYVAKSRIAKRLAEELRHLSADIPWLAGPP